MYLLLILLLGAHSSVQATSTSTITQNPPAQTLLQSLPAFIMSRIAKFTDNKTSAMLGMANKELFEVTKQRNNKTRLLKIKEHCGLKQYLDMTSNGHLLFSKTIDNIQSTGGIEDALIKLELCNKALANNINVIGERLTQLTISFPSLQVSMSSALNSAILSYFESLEALIKYKSNFKLVIVSTIDERKPYYVHKASEKKLLMILTQLSIDELILRVKLRGPNFLINPTIMKLSAQEEFYRNMENHSGLPNLRSVIFPSLNKIEPLALRIAQSPNITEIRIPKHLVAEALSDSYFINKIEIHELVYQNYHNHLIALMETRRRLTALKIGWHVRPSVSDMSGIFLKFRSSLESLSIKLEIISEHTRWVNLLRTLLNENNILKHLSISVKPDGFFDHSFLESAVNLESYSYCGVLPSDSRTQSLFTFIATHTSLKTLSLKFFGILSKIDFFEFYDKLIVVIQANQSIKHVTFVSNISVMEFQEFAIEFSQKMKPLLGRELVFNTIPVENIVSDLASGHDNGITLEIQNQGILME